MSRIPNNYEVSVDPEPASLSVIDDHEFSQFVAGQTEQLSPAMKKKVKLAMKDASAKLNIFFMAIAQKNAHRLARVMGALDNVDKELLQGWRIKTMNTEELLELFSELNVERHRTTKGLLEMSNKFEGNLPSMSHFLDDEIEESVRELPRASKKRVVDFFKQKIATAT